ncbi:MAG: hypothetical protein A2061_10050 [Gallionellales bacterium GWA2_59_43]|nr:MAG: hypothetical protein A2061_10050 [Gallionellales bacterium GWA2_59_43]
MTEVKAKTPVTFRRVAKYIAIAIGVLAIALILFVAVLYWWMSGGVFTVSRFDRTQWFAPQTEAAEFTCYRGKMAGDIKNRLLIPGMSRQDAEHLLGVPAEHVTPAEYQYILGVCSGFMIDYDVLHIYFDPDGKYTSSEIVQH